MRICTHGSSSILAMAAGALFLVLPVAFLKGAVSINVLFAAGPPCTFGIPSPTNPYCPLAIVPMPDAMALNLIFLGAIGILLGFVALRLDPRPRTSVALGFAISLGLLAFLFESAISHILESFSVGPVFVLAFPDLSIAVMAVSTFAFVYEMVRAGFSRPLTIAEANAHQ